MISIVTPVYGCTASLESLVARVDGEMQAAGERYELVLVNDCSPDGAWAKIESLCQRFSSVRGVNLSRNFGQHPAILAGLNHSVGECVVVMDCDLQDPPEEIPKLVAAYREGYDVVIGLRDDRADNWFRRGASKAFFGLLSWMIGEQIPHNNRNFGAYSRAVCDVVVGMATSSQSFGLAVRWAGFRRKELRVKHSPRDEGKSSYKLLAMLRLAFETILAHSTRPLKIIMVAGFALAALSCVAGLVLVLRYLMFGVTVAGWTSLSVLLFLGVGAIIGTLGIVGLYLGLMYDEVKRRPSFIVSEVIGTSGISSGAAPLHNSESVGS